MKRKITFFIFVSMVLTIMSVVSCNGKNNDDIQGSAEIDFWTTETQAERLAVINAMVDTFEVLNPNISVNVVPIDENDFHSQIAVAVQGNGRLPDIGEVPSGTVVSFGTQGLIDTDTVEEILSDYNKDSFFKGALDLVRSTDGKEHYGVPYHGWIQGIWYRKDWFQNAGLEPPTSWSDILSAAKYFNNPQDNTYGILIGTDQDVYAEQAFTPFAFSNDAGLFNGNETLVFNSEKMKETVLFYKNLAQYTPPGPQTWRARDYYLQNKLAMFFYSTYIMDDLVLQEKAASSLTGENFDDLTGSAFDPKLVDKTGFAPIISNKTNAGYGTLVTLSVFKNTDENKTKASKKFAEFMMEPNNYITFLHMAPGGMLPMREGIANTEAFLDDPEGIYEKYGSNMLEEIIEGFKSIKTFNIVDGHQIEAANVIFSNQIIPKMLYQVIQEGKNVDEAMAEANQKMEDVIASLE